MARIKRVRTKESKLLDSILKSQIRIIPLFSSSSRDSKLLLIHNKASNTTIPHTNQPTGEAWIWSEKYLI